MGDFLPYHSLFPISKSDKICLIFPLTLGKIRGTNSLHVLPGVQDLLEIAPPAAEL